MNSEDTTRMAREAGAAMIHSGEHALMGNFALETFFQKAYAAGAAAEREKEKERQRYDIHSCGPDCDRHICVAVRNALNDERQACAEMVRPLDESLADAIRARGQQ